MIRLVCSDRDAPIKLNFGKNFSNRDSVRVVLNRLHGHDTNTATGVRAGALGTGKHLKPPASPVAPVSVAEHKRRENLLDYPEVMRLHARLVQQTGVVRQHFSFRSN